MVTDKYNRANRLHIMEESDESLDRQPTGLTQGTGRASEQTVVSNDELLQKFSDQRKAQEPGRFTADFYYTLKEKK
jgi:hypothetical protein